jgi:hypothetical protein
LFKKKRFFKLWNELCEIISKNPTKIKSVPVEPIIRQGILKYKDQVGQLWTSLADYYIRSGCFEKVENEIFSTTNKKNKYILFLGSRYI